MAAALRIRGGSLADAADRFRAIGADTPRPRPRMGHSATVHGVAAARPIGTAVRVTRTDIGTRNAPLTTPVRGTGRKNPRSDARFTANPDRMSYITAERVDAMATDTHTHSPRCAHHSY